MPTYDIEPSMSIDYAGATERAEKTAEEIRTDHAVNSVRVEAGRVRVRLKPMSAPLAGATIRRVARQYGLSYPATDVTEPGEERSGYGPEDQGAGTTADSYEPLYRLNGGI